MSFACGVSLLVELVAETDFSTPKEFVFYLGVQMIPHKAAKVDEDPETQIARSLVKER